MQKTQSILLPIFLGTCVHSVSASHSHIMHLSLSLFSFPLSLHTQCLSLDLSVGRSGCVYSFETVPRHQARAKANYNNWRCSWDISHPENPWPDNVHFIEADVSDAQEHIHNCSIDAVSCITFWLV